MTEEQRKKQKQKNKESKQASRAGLSKDFNQAQNV
jgi:hypothetical protein